MRSLHGLVLPDASGFRREIVSPPERQGAKFCEEYDFHTLVYDAFYCPKRRALGMICPPFRNLASVFRDARWSSGRRRLRTTRIIEHKRFAEVWMKGVEHDGSIEFRHGDFSGQILPSTCEPEMFANLRCALTKSRNNDLRWLSDWAQYHATVHGLEGIVLFEHMSDRYSAEEVEATLSSVRGIKKVCIVPSSYRFGPTTDNNALFLQVAEMNIARLRFLSQAAGVLCVDIDELVAPSPHGSIFETARRSPLGYALFHGSWRYPQGGETSGTRLHCDHVMRRSGDAACQTKYCVRPKGLVGNVHWDIHGSVRGALKSRLVTDKAHYWHCWGVSTSWKGDRDAAGDGVFVLDEPLERLLEDVLPRERVNDA